MPEQKPHIVKLSFDGVMADCLVTVDDNGEFVCYTKDRRFVKFPKGADLDAEVKRYNDLHTEVPIFAEEVEARQAAKDAWFEDAPVEEVAAPQE